jgi:hypothetical protein
MAFSGEYGLGVQGKISVDCDIFSMHRACQIKRRKKAQNDRIYTISCFPDTGDKKIISRYVAQGIFGGIQGIAKLEML